MFIKMIYKDVQKSCSFSWITFPRYTGFLLHYQAFQPKSSTIQHLQILQHLAIRSCTSKNLVLMVSCGANGHNINLSSTISRFRLEKFTPTPHLVPMTVLQYSLNLLKKLGRIWSQGSLQDVNPWIHGQMAYNKYRFATSSMRYYQFCPKRFKFLCCFILFRRPYLDQVTAKNKLKHACQPSSSAKIPYDYSPRLLVFYHRCNILEKFKKFSMSVDQVARKIIIFGFVLLGGLGIYEA